MIYNVIYLFYVLLEKLAFFSKQLYKGLLYPKDNKNTRPLVMLHINETKIKVSQKLVLLGLAIDNQLTFRELVNAYVILPFKSFTFYVRYGNA